MSREKIPVYDICSLGDAASNNHEFLADHFSAYLDKYYPTLHFPHRHSFYHLVLFTAGKGSHTIDFTRFAIKPGQVYFMIPGQVHSWDFKGKMEGYIINFSDNFFKSFLLDQHYLDRFGFLSGVSEEGVCQLPADTQQSLSRLFEQIISYALHLRENTDLIRVLLLQIFITIENLNQIQDSRSAPRQKQVLLRNFRRLIDFHYRSLRLPKEYADLLYITPNHLNALCQDLLGKTAGELIRDRVLLEAKRLLTNAKMTVTEIAYDLNFEDNSYFNRFFKKYTGVTPDEFRKQFRH